MSLDYGPVRGQEDIDAHARNMAWSFHIGVEELRKAFDRFGIDNLRVLRDGDRPVAGYTLLPLGQWFGGRTVPMGGVNLVGVAPEHRGRGTATRLMHEAVREMSRTGYPISALYPAKQTLYRRAGYELAGGRYRLTVRASDLTFGDRAGELREIGEADRPAVESLYDAHAAEHPGMLARPDFMWARVKDPRDAPARGFLVAGENGVEGYTYLYEAKGEGLRHDLMLTDFVARTPTAARRLLRFLGDHASLAGDVSWFGDPAEPALALLPEQTWKQQLFFHWMVRILDVGAALEARGYPAGLAGEVHFEVEDDLLEGNRGRFVLEVADGRGRVRRGGDGRVRCGVRGLASIYTGFLSPAGARVAGLAAGADDDLAAARPLFAGRTPWMPDMF